MDPEIVAEDLTLQHQSTLLNAGTAGGITVGIFAVWSILAFCVVGWGLRYDRTDDRMLARKMRNLRDGIRVIYMSGYSEHAAGEAAKCDAAAVVLTKPFSRTVLLRTVRDVLPIPTA